MAKEYKVGEKYYLSVTVNHIYNSDYSYPIEIVFNDGVAERTESLPNNPGLLLTAEEIYANRRTADTIEHLTDMMDYGRQKYDEIAELKSRNAELEALLKEVMATRDEAIKQNNELIAENDKLKAERDDLASQLGKNLAEIQDLNAEIHFLKAERDKLAKTAKDKADLANKACDERNDAQGDLVTAREAIDYLQEENNKLKREVENRMTDYKLMRDNNAVYLSRIAIQNEVIDALVEKIRRLKGSET